VEPTIIIPDVHQNYSFLEKLLGLHRPESVARYVFLGDLFDAKDSFFANLEALEKTLTLVSDLVKATKNKVVLILGNHDVLYFFSRDESGLKPAEKNTLYEYYGMPDRSKMTLLREKDFSNFWDLFQLAHYEQGFLCSHAGITKDYWSTRASVEDNVENLNLRLGNLIDSKGEINPLFRAGFSRGGDLPRGGPLWLDWTAEFTDEIDIPQIVGHTVGVKTRKSGRSYCLDAQQRCYGILKEGQLEIREV